MKQEQLKSWTDTGVLVGMLILAVMALLPLVGVQSALWMRVTYAGGAALVLVARLVAPGAPEGASLRVRRLHRLLVAAAVLFVTSAVLLFVPTMASGRDSLAFLMAGAIMQVYASTMLDKLNKPKTQ